MSNQFTALEIQYRKCAEAFGEASVRGDAKTINKNFDKLVVIGPKLRAYGALGEAILRGLMKDRSDATKSLHTMKQAGASPAIER
jgi:hypothetical protein